MSSPLSDPHLWFTADDAKGVGLKLNKSPAHVVQEPNTAGEKTTAALVNADIEHYSLRPSEAVDIPEGISYDELERRTDLHLGADQMKQLADRSKELGVQEMRPRALKC